jgi:hypothetical protein
VKNYRTGEEPSPISDWGEGSEWTCAPGHACLPTLLSGHWSFCSEPRVSILPSVCERAPETRVRSEERGTKVQLQVLKDQNERIYFAYLYRPTLELSLVVQVCARKDVPHHICSVLGQYPTFNTKTSCHNCRGCYDHNQRF